MRISGFAANRPPHDTCYVIIHCLKGRDPEEEGELWTRRRWIAKPAAAERPDMPRIERSCRLANAWSQKRQYARPVGEREEVTDKYDSKRGFQMWLYEVGHSQLLLRSVKDDAHSTRVDILFKSVDSLHLPTNMVGLTISRRDEGFRMSG